VVRLALPDDGSRPTAHHPDLDSEPKVDTGRLARVVEDVIRALDPSLAESWVEVAITRARPGQTDRALTSTSDPSAESDLHLDLAGRTLTVDGRVVTLTRREFDLLAYLRDRRGIALSRRELMSTVWQSGYLVGDRTIDVHIRRLRVKLGRHADRLSTLRGYGYRLD
jgi:DNA-binding response OmpR family regulator